MPYYGVIYGISRHIGWGAVVSLRYLLFPTYSFVPHTNYKPIRGTAMPIQTQDTLLQDLMNWQKKNKHTHFIYLYENIINEKCYVGQTNKMQTRDRAHARGDDAKDNSIFDVAMLQYGREQFRLTVIDIAYTPEEADQIEVYWIARLREFRGKDQVYNITDGGKSLTQEARDRISKKLLGRPSARKGVKTGRPAWNKGIPMTEEAKKKLSATNTGKKRTPHSEETKQKLSAALTGKKRTTPIWNKGLPAHNKGVSPSAETLKKMSESQRTPLTEQDKDNIRTQRANGSTIVELLWSYHISQDRLRRILAGEE